MGLFDMLGKPLQQGQQRQQQQMTPEQARQQFEQSMQSLHKNPVNFARNSRLNVPDNMTDAGEIINYLERTNQIPRGMLQQARMMAQRMSGFIK